MCFFVFRKPKIQEVILLTVEETRVIPIDLIKSELPTNGNDAVVEGVNDNTKEEQTVIKSEDPLINVNENEEKDKVDEEKSVEEEKVEEIKSEEEVKGEDEEKNAEEEKVEETEVEE